MQTMDSIFEEHTWKSYKDPFFQLIKNCIHTLASIEKGLLAVQEMVTEHRKKAKGRNNFLIIYFF